MEEFRRFIIFVVGGLEILFVIAVTLICGGIGAALSDFIGGSGAGLIGFLMGGFTGFCISAIIVNISMNLTEIAQNTQRTAELLEETTGRTPSKRKAKTG